MLSPGLFKVHLTISLLAGDSLSRRSQRRPIFLLSECQNVNLESPNINQVCLSNQQAPALVKPPRVLISSLSPFNLFLLSTN